MILVNGTPVLPENATVRALDAGFLYGETVFTTVGIVNRTPVFLDRHIERLARMAEALGIASCPGPETLRLGVKRMIDIHDPVPRLLRITVTPGPLSAATIDRTPEAPGSWYVFPVFRSDPDPAVYETGVDVDLGPPLALPALDPRSHLKTGNLLLSRWLRSRKRPSSVDILLSGRAGRLLEGTVSNVFFVENSGTIMTPPESWGVLPGIVRSVVLEILGQDKTAFRFDSPTRKALSDVREIFLTNSYLGVMPVSRLLNSVDGRKRESIAWTASVQPEVSRLLRKELAGRIRKEIEAWQEILPVPNPARLQERKSPD